MANTTVVTQQQTVGLLIRAGNGTSERAMAGYWGSTAAHALCSKARLSVSQHVADRARGLTEGHVQQINAFFSRRGCLAACRMVQCGSEGCGSPA